MEAMGRRGRELDDLINLIAERRWRPVAVGGEIIRRRCCVERGECLVDLGDQLDERLIGLDRHQCDASVLDR